MKNKTVHPHALNIVFPKYKRPRNPKLEERITIRLDAEYYDELLKISHRDGFSVSNIVRHLVKRFIETERQFGFSAFKGGA